jgi:hypothetical protein
MHGTLLDQRVFESLVHRCLPIIHDHFVKVDVQLSVASLPWFLSLCAFILLGRGRSTLKDDLVLKVHQQHAFDICFSNHGLLLLHGSEGPLPSWVSGFLAHHALLT